MYDTGEEPEDDDLLHENPNHARGVWGRVVSGGMGDDDEEDEDEEEEEETEEEGSVHSQGHQGGG
jgi:hypothetical protein